MIAYVEQLFSGERIVRSTLIRNDTLIQRARAFLDSSNATQRIYERAKAELSKKTPDDFSLLRAVGPQAGAVFTRASGAPLSRGVPGLFTFDGYRKMFDTGLQEFALARSCARRRRIESFFAAVARPCVASNATIRRTPLTMSIIHDFDSPGIHTMIIRPKLNWFRLLFVWRGGSVLPQLLPRLGLIFALSIAAIFMHDHMRSYPLGLGTPLFALVGIARSRCFLAFAIARVTSAGGKAANYGACCSILRGR